MSLGPLEPTSKQWSTIDPDDTYLDKVDLDEEINAYIEVGDETHEAIEVGVTEYLDFHLEHDNIEKDLLDEDSYLTRDAFDRIETFFAQQLKNTYWDTETFALLGGSLEVDDSVGGDDPHFTVRFYIPRDYRGTVQDVLDGTIFPFFACVTNVTDPGTFNSPYLFSNV